MRKYLLSFAVFVSVLIVSQGAWADPISSTDLAGDPDVVTLTFDELATGTYVDTEYSGDGATFTTGGVVTFLSPGQVLSVSEELVIDFSVNVDMVGVDFSSDSYLTLEVYDSGDNLIESVTATTLAGFFGISTEADGKIISKVVIHDHGYGFTIDNFSFRDPVPVPEPSTLVLLGAGLAGLGLLRRRAKS